MSYRDKLLDYFRRRNRGWVLSLFAAVCIVYAPFLGNPFVFDDLHMFSGNMAEHYTHSPFQLELRWLSYASLGWTVAIFGDVLPHVFRLGNMLLHAANVILLFFLLRLWVSAAVPDNARSAAAIGGAWIGALVFACHPVAVYAVGYVIERSILMAALFSLVTQLAYCHGLLTGKRRWLALAVAAYFLACFSKEHSIMVPALLAVQSFLLRTKITVAKSALWATWSAFIAIALLLAVLRAGVLGAPYEVMAAALFEQHEIVESSTMLHGLSALTQAGLFFKYLLLWAVPNPAWMSLDMREHFISTAGSWQSWPGAMGFAVYGMLGGWLLSRPGWRMRLAGLALLYPWLQFMVEFPPIRVQEIFVLYRSYLWMPGMMLFFPLLLAGLPSRRIFLGGGLIALLLVPLAWNRLWVFADNYRLWNDAALLLRGEREMGADRIFYNRGRAELDASKWEDAIADFKRAITLSPQLAPIHYLLGAAYINTGRPQDALAQFDTAIALKPEDASYYYAKGISLKRLHRDEPAMRQMEKSCELKNQMACAIVQMNPDRK